MYIRKLYTGGRGPCSLFIGSGCWWICYDSRINLEWRYWMEASCMKCFEVWLAGIRFYTDYRRYMYTSQMHPCIRSYRSSSLPCTCINSQRTSYLLSLLVGQSPSAICNSKEFYHHSDPCRRWDASVLWHTCSIPLHERTHQLGNRSCLNRYCRGDCKLAATFPRRHLPDLQREVFCPVSITIANLVMEELETIDVQPDTTLLETILLRWYLHCHFKSLTHLH